MEVEVFQAAMSAMESGEAKVLNFGVADEVAWSAGLSCGGEIRVFVCSYHGIQKNLFGKVRRSLTIRKNTRIKCDFKNGTVKEGNGRKADEIISKSATKLFQFTIIPKPRVFVIGAVQIAQNLVPMAMNAGYEVIVVDPRSQFATKKRFPGVKLYVDWPDEVLERQKLSKDDSLITLTHDPKIDDVAICFALQKKILSISCLGSKVTNFKRQNRLLKEGFSANQLNYINSPAGLPIGAKTPAEIAVSILAYLIKIRRNLSNES